MRKKAERPPARPNRIFFPNDAGRTAMIPSRNALLDKDLLDFMISEWLRLFPVRSNAKQPAISNWQQAATSDKARIYAWFLDRNAPFKGYNVGVATGQGLVVLDFDCKGGRPGLDTLAVLDMMGLPESFRVNTPSGGVHVYFRMPSGEDDLPCRVDPPGFPGMDVRGKGGYVVGPGSMIDGAFYAVA